MADEVRPDFSPLTRANVMPLTEMSQDLKIKTRM